MIDIDMKNGIGTVTYFGTEHPAHVEMHTTRTYVTERCETGTLLTMEIWLAKPEERWEDSYETP